MKRTGFGGILALLLSLGLVSVEVRADDLQRFLAQLQSEAASQPVAKPAGQPFGVIGEKELSSAACYAEVNCPSGGSVFYEGQESCESRPDVCWVLCDGQFTSCPICW